MKNEEFLRGLEMHGTFLNTKISDAVKESLHEILFIREGATYGNLEELLKICKKQHEFKELMKGEE